MLLARHWPVGHLHRMGEGTPSVFRIEIRNIRPLRARDAGRLIEEFVTAYDRFQRVEKLSSSARAELRLVGIFLGSFVIDLAALGLSAAAVAFSFDESRAAMVRFIARLSRVARITAGEEKGRVDPIERRVVETVRELLADDVVLIAIYVLGDNGERFEQKAAAAEVREPAPLPSVPDPVEKMVEDAELDRLPWLEAVDLPDPSELETSPRIVPKSAQVVGTKLVYKIDLRERTAFFLEVDIDLLTELSEWKHRDDWLFLRAYRRRSPTALGNDLRQEIDSALAKAWEPSRLKHRRLGYAIELSRDDFEWKA